MSALTAYGDILRIPSARRALWVGLLIRIPMWAGAVILTLHVVSHLGRSYTAAGVVVTAVTLAAAVSGPWRGRLLDRRGLRSTVLPSLLVLTVCWSTAPWVGYWALLPLVALAGLFVVPTFSIIRQVLISSVDDERRKTALVLDSVAVELSFMIGPALGVLAATYLGTPWSMLICELLSVVGGLVLWIMNPPLLRSDSTEITEITDITDITDSTGTAAEPVAGTARTGARQWLSPAVLAVLATSLTATVVLTGTDVGVVAALRDWGHQPSIGWILAIWGAGSAIGGLIYGAVKQNLSAFVLVGLLGITTVAVALADDRLWIAVLLFVSGLFCAPTITATIDTLSRVVPVAVRGEALGWHGSALTTGSAIGAPLAGLAIDHGGWQWGFVLAGAVGVLIGLSGWGATRRRRRRRPAAGTRRPAQSVTAGG